MDFSELLIKYMTGIVLLRGSSLIEEMPNLSDDERLQLEVILGEVKAQLANV